LSDGAGGPTRSIRAVPIQTAGQVLHAVQGMVASRIGPPIQAIFQVIHHLSASEVALLGSGQDCEVDGGAIMDWEF
jgi:hypothetical protein